LERALVQKGAEMTTAVMEVDSAIKSHESVTYLLAKMTLHVLLTHTATQTALVKTGVESARHALMSLMRMDESSSVMRHLGRVSHTAPVASQMRVLIAVRRVLRHNATPQEASS
jgi:hypothetical protein